MIKLACANKERNALSRYIKPLKHAGFHRLRPDLRCSATYMASSVRSSYCSDIICSLFVCSGPSFVIPDISKTLTSGSKSGFTTIILPGPVPGVGDQSPGTDHTRQLTSPSHLTVLNPVTRTSDVSPSSGQTKQVIIFTASPYAPQEGAVQNNVNRTANPQISNHLTNNTQNAESPQLRRSELVTNDTQNAAVNQQILGNGLLANSAQNTAILPQLLRNGLPPNNEQNIAVVPQFIGNDLMRNNNVQNTVTTSQLHTNQYATSSTTTMASTSLLQSKQPMQTVPTSDFSNIINSNNSLTFPSEIILPNPVIASSAVPVTSDITSSCSAVITRSTSSIVVNSSVCSLTVETDCSSSINTPVISIAENSVLNSDLLDSVNALNEAMAACPAPDNHLDANIINEAESYSNNGDKKQDTGPNEKSSVRQEQTREMPYKADDGCTSSVVTPQSHGVTSYVSSVVDCVTSDPVAVSEFSDQQGAPVSPFIHSQIDSPNPIVLKTVHSDLNNLTSGFSEVDLPQMVDRKGIEISVCNNSLENEVNGSNSSITNISTNSEPPKGRTEKTPRRIIPIQLSSTVSTIKKVRRIVPVRVPSHRILKSPSKMKMLKKSVHHTRDTTVYDHTSKGKEVNRLAVENSEKHQQEVFVCKGVDNKDSENHEENIMALSTDINSEPDLISRVDGKENQKNLTSEDIETSVCIRSIPLAMNTSCSQCVHKVSSVNQRSAFSENRNNVMLSAQLDGTDNPDPENTSGKSDQSSIYDGEEEQVDQEGSANQNEAPVVSMDTEQDGNMRDLNAGGSDNVMIDSANYTNQREANFGTSEVSSADVGETTGVTWRNDTDGMTEVPSDAQIEVSASRVAVQCQHQQDQHHQQQQQQGRTAVEIMAAVAPYLTNIMTSSPSADVEETNTGRQQATPTKTRYRSVAPRPGDNPRTSPPKFNLLPLRKQKSPRRKMLQQKAKSILPKGFIINTYVSPSKKVAANLAAKARRSGRPKGSRDTRPRTRSCRFRTDDTDKEEKQSEDVDLMAAGDIERSSEYDYDTIDSDYEENDAADKEDSRNHNDALITSSRKQSVKKRLYGRGSHDSDTQSDTEDGTTFGTTPDSQDDDEEGHMAQLLAASTTIRSVSAIWRHFNMSQSLG